MLHDHVDAVSVLEGILNIIIVNASIKCCQLWLITSVADPDTDLFGRIRILAISTNQDLDVGDRIRILEGREMILSKLFWCEYMYAINSCH
jgi:hypothetical protein